MSIKLNKNITQEELEDFLELLKLAKTLWITIDWLDWLKGKDWIDWISIKGKDWLPWIPWKDWITIKGKDWKDWVWLIWLPWLIWKPWKDWLPWIPWLNAKLLYEWRGTNLCLWDEEIQDYKCFDLIGKRWPIWFAWDIWPAWKTPTFDEWLWFEDTDYLYVVFWEDENWIVDRFLRTNMTKTTTWNQTWDKPTTLGEVQILTYN